MEPGKPFRRWLTLALVHGGKKGQIKVDARATCSACRNVFAFTFAIAEGDPTPQISAERYADISTPKTCARCSCGTVGVQSGH